MCGGGELLGKHLRSNFLENKILNMIKNFAKNESGAVTIDWVILTAGVVVLGIASYNIVKDITSDLANNTVTDMEEFNCGLFSDCD